MAQVEYIGRGTLAQCGRILDELNAKRVFLVTGENSFARSGAEDYFRSLEHSGILRFSVGSELPEYEEVICGVKAYEAHRPDVVVTVGGGLIMDVAKAINGLAFQNPPLDDYVTGKNINRKMGKPLIAIPTTAGTGSECTHFAVVYKDGIKYSFASEYLRPSYSIVDPELSKNVPKKTAVASALDALCQSVESFWSKKSTEISRTHSRYALTLVWSNLIRAIDEKDAEAQELLCLGAHEAGKAIDIAQTTVCHALSYGLTHHFKIPHGVAAAITIPVVYRHNSADPSADPAVFDELNSILGVNSALQASNVLEELLVQYNVSKLTPLGIKLSDIPMLVREVNKERLSNNPSTITERDLKNFLESVL